MKSKFLIINCPSEYFSYIPMGTFGTCDYLDKKGIQVKILNLALYDTNEIRSTIVHYMNFFQPTHVGIVFHWQETAEEVIDVGEFIKKSFDKVKIVCGGFTAGYFSESILKQYPFIDFIIKGDPERPLELLLEGVEPSEIPNLSYRDNNGIRSNKVSYDIDQDNLSQISFSEMTYLYDYELYIKAVEDKLGFPIFIGRGCAFNCRYCGGSKMAFSLHTGKTRPVARSIESVIKDLKRIKDFTSKIYICYENNRSCIKELFKEIKRDGSLVKIFNLNYGAWHLFDSEFLDLYREIFAIDGDKKPVFELSPEVHDDKGRKEVKQNTSLYSVEDIVNNLKLINSYFGNSLNTSVFFSRYHDTASTYADMKREITGIFRLKHTLLSMNITNAYVCYDHLSTDVASKYWESYMKNPKDFNTLLSAMKKMNSQEYFDFPVNNLCFYIPDNLSREDIMRCELLIYLLKRFEIYFFEMFHIMFRCLDEEIINVFEDIVSEKYYSNPESVFESIDDREILNKMRKKIIEDNVYISRIPFVEDMTELFLKKAFCMDSRVSGHDMPHNSQPKLNAEFISVYKHDYLDLSNFLKRIENKGAHGLVTEKTVFIFLIDDILSMPYETYSRTLKAFEEGMSLEAYYDLMKKRGIFTPSYHENLIGRLFRSNVLS